MNKYLKLLAVVSFACSQVACNTEKESTRVVSDFWKGMATNDKALLASVLEDKKQAEFLSQGKSTLTNYEVLDEVPNGVEVKFSRFCYADMVIPTILKEVDGALKVDLRLTLRAQMAAYREAVPLKQYCYDFDDKPLSGKLNNIAWHFNKVVNREINWGDKITTNTTLYSEDCNTETYGECTQPSLIISNLDLTGVGGNFDNKVNVTIHIPPSDNVIISDGSYRVTESSEGKKVEISFKKANENTLSGYFILDK